MGYLKSAVEYSLVYAESAKLNDYVSSIRKSFKPADSMAAQVEAVLSTHGADVVTKIDTKLDPVVDIATEKYGQAKEKYTSVIEYAQMKKDGVKTYAQEKKESVVMKAKETRQTVSAGVEDIVKKVKSGEVEQKILKKAASNAYTDYLAKTIFLYKGKLLVNAKTLSTQIQTKGNEQIVAFKALAADLKGKLPIAEVKAKVAKLTDIVMATSSPYVAMVTPYWSKGKAEFFVVKSKVYEQVMKLKSTYLAKKTA